MASWYGLPPSAALVAAEIRRRHPKAPALSAIKLVTWAKKHARADAQSRPVYQRTNVDVVTDEFLKIYAWRRLRMEVLKERGRRCECCGATPADGKTVVHVDHIKSRRNHPELALDKSNLQVLCEVCNHGKGNWDETDWRAESVAAVVFVPTEQAEAVIAARPRLVKKGA